jgi:hypothetical protein
VQDYSCGGRFSAVRCNFKGRKTMPTLYKQIPTSSTTANAPVPIPGLSLDVPEGIGALAVIILNAPQASAKGGKNPGGTFFLSIDGTRSHQAIRFGGSSQSPNGAYVPCTLVAAVALKIKPQKVQVEYFAEPDATLSTGPASLTIMAD